MLGFRKDRRRQRIGWSCRTRFRKISFTQPAHIFPESLAMGHDNANKVFPVFYSIPFHRPEDLCQVNWVATVWTVMQRFGNISAAFEQELHGDRIHGLNNVLTLSPDVHQAYDQLMLCLLFKDAVGVFLRSCHIFLQVFNFDSRLVS